MSGLARAGKVAVGAAAAAPTQGPAGSAGALIERLNSRYDKLHREFEDGAWPRSNPPGGGERTEGTGRETAGGLPLSPPLSPPLSLLRNRGTDPEGVVARPRVQRSGRRRWA